MSGAEPVRIAVVGTGKITRSFLAAAQSCEGFSLAAVCSRSEERGKAFASEYGEDITCFTDPAALAASGLCDAVYIAVPNVKHFEMSKLFLLHGIPVLCEKPFTSNLAEAEELFRIADEKGILIMEAMRSLAMPGFRSIRENLEKLGKIRRVTASKCQYSSRYDHFKEGIIENAFRPELSNGALMDIGRYCVAPVVELFGMPNAVSGSAQFLSTGADASGTVILSYDGMDAVLMYSKVSDSELPFEIQGENGTLTAEDIYEFKNPVIRYRDGSLERLAPIEEGVSSSLAGGAAHLDPNVMTYEIREFLRCVKERQVQSAFVTREQTENSMKVMDEIRSRLGITFQRR